LLTFGKIRGVIKHFEVGASDRSRKKNQQEVFEKIMVVVLLGVCGSCLGRTFGLEVLLLLAAGFSIIFLGF
jgi:hypothetical protein